jgi:hypothetical protein
VTGLLLWFALTGSTRWRTLWLTAGVITVGWFSYGATDFWFGHLQTVLGDLGQVGDVVSGGLTDRLSGDPVYQGMQGVRMAWTGLLGVLALVGWWTIRRRRDAVLLAGLAAAPFGLILLQSYGGEMLIRCALYSSVFLAPLAAVAVVRAGQAVTRAAPVARTALLATALVLGAFGLTLTRGLNVSFERVSDTHIRVAQQLMATVPDGASVGTFGRMGTLPLGRVGTVTVEPLVSGSCGADFTACLLDAVGADGAAGPDWVVAAATAEAAGRLQGGRPAGWVGAGVTALLATGGYETVVTDPEIVVLRRVPSGQSVGTGSADAADAADGTAVGD